MHFRFRWYRTPKMKLLTLHTRRQAQNFCYKKDSTASTAGARMNMVRFVWRFLVALSRAKGW